MTNENTTGIIEQYLVSYELVKELYDYYEYVLDEENVMYVCAQLDEEQSTEDPEDPNNNVEVYKNFCLLGDKYELIASINEALFYQYEYCDRSYGDVTRPLYKLTLNELIPPNVYRNYAIDKILADLETA